MDYYEVQQSRLTGATIVSTIAGHLAGIIYHVTLGELSMELAAYLILAGGITGGLLHGRTFRECLWYAVPFSVLSIIQMFTTYSCLSLRGCVFIPEIIIPFAVAFVSFVVTYWLVRSHLEHHELVLDD